MTGSGDDVGDMSATLLDDATIDALIRGDGVHPTHHDLAAFVADVRATGDRPPPSPSRALAALLVAGPPAEATVRGRRATRARVAGRGLAVKLAASAAATAAVLGAGAAGMLPAGADTVVRSAIEAVTPVKFVDEDRSPGSSPDGPGPLSDAPAVVPGGDDHPAGEPAGEGTDGPVGDRDGEGDEDTVRGDGPRSDAATGDRDDPTTSGGTRPRGDDRPSDQDDGVSGGDRVGGDRYDDRYDSDSDSGYDYDSDDHRRQDDRPADIADRVPAPRSSSTATRPRPSTVPGTTPRTATPPLVTPPTRR